MGYTLKLVETHEDKANDSLDLISGADGIYLNQEGLYLPEPPSIWLETGESFRNDGESLGAQKYKNREMTIDLFVEGENKGNLLLKIQELQEFVRKASYCQLIKTGNYKNYDGDGIAHRVELRYALSDLPDTSFGRGRTRFEIVNGNVKIPTDLHSHNLTADRIDGVELNLTLKPFSYGKIMPIGKGYATSWDFDIILQEENAITFHPSYLCDIKYPTFVDTEEGTVSFWFRAIDPSTWANDRAFFCTNLGTSGYLFYYDHTNQRFVFGEGVNSVVFSKTFSANQLLHLVIRWHADPSRIQISIDGSHQVNLNYTEPVGITHCHIGGNNSHLNACNGHIYDFRAWKSELSDNQVTQVYKEGIGRTLLPLFDKEIIYNHHDNTVHTNYFNVLGVPGDVPAGALINLDNSGEAGRNIKTVRLSQRTQRGVDKFRHIWEGEDRTGDLEGTWTPENDATCSNGQRLPIILNDPAKNFGCYWQKTADLMENEGVFQAFARVYFTTTASPIDFRVRFGANGYFDNAWVSSDLGDKWHILDLGEIPYPCRDICYKSDRYYILLYFEANCEITKTIYLDYLALFPKKPAYGEWEAGVSLITSAYGIAFETLDYQQVWQMIYPSGGKEYAWDVSGEGAMGDIFLEPRIPNHFRIIADRDPTDTHLNFIDDQFSLQNPNPAVLARYLTME